MRGERVVVTGGTGSFGKAFVKAALSAGAHKVIVFSRDELKQYEMAQGADPRVAFFIGDVRDKDRLYRAFRGADAVVHAAAMKQVPACEFNPFEAVKTNVLGAQNVIEAAIDCGVRRVVALSSDKSACPINLYGATKLCSDKLFMAGNAYSPNGTRFSVVRYGNVMGSRGSVIPLFMKQRETGTVTITDQRMTRFWITMDQAVAFVQMALSRMKGGEIFVPKIPSMKVTDLAEAIAPGCKHHVIGIRGGEKLHEVLIPEEECGNAREMDFGYVIRREQSEVPVCKAYRSDTNPWFLTVDEMRGML